MAGVISRRTKKKIAVVFVSSFILVFGLLNSRFVDANVDYWLKADELRANKKDMGYLPISSDKKALPLPNNAMLTISSIGVNAPIIFGVPAQDKDIYGSLQNGVVHYSETAKPGDDKGGLSYILGHSSAYPWYKGSFGAVFALLGKLNAGERFIIQYSDGRRFLYEVKESVVFNPFSGDDPNLMRIEQEGVPGIVLISCWPVGTNYRRIAVYAQLVSN